MKESKNWRRLWLELALLGALGVWGCNREPPPVKPFAIAPDAAKKAMEFYDANGDGFLEGAELDKAPGLKAALEQVDANHDGKISAEEIDARIAAWKASGVGRLTVYCRVTRRGKPLAGATLTFVPEELLGRRHEAGQGKDEQVRSGHALHGRAGAVAGRLAGLLPRPDHQERRSHPSPLQHRDRLGPGGGPGLAHGRRHGPLRPGLLGAIPLRKHAHGQSRTPRPKRCVELARTRSDLWPPALLPQGTRGRGGLRTGRSPSVGRYCGRTG